MEREILFRGKSVDSGKWIEGSLCVAKNGRCHISTWSGKDNSFRLFQEVNPKTVGQYTGLNDFNANKIYEGDKCAFRNSIIGIVEYWNGIFTIREEGSESRYKLVYVIKEIEIIGNIHDNK